ncbi:uncharacterized protein [Physcomitrium patens]|uniref:Selenoprotein F n=1 Tax=Physcomitrium patens TaxID=3218 RepID=A9TVR5_PHYPA|nr:selenoprotein F-like [Physcomitrium patens]PNR40494.1 hypothetical protein PHYPA_017896 [Physcomitrium patens]|eukprot:XP_024394495.1 selenoprotein F-like [Physcomitrella patens]
MGVGRVEFCCVVSALLIFALQCAFYGVQGEVLSEATCEDLGFTGLALCTDCDSIAEYVKDKELEADCRKCCAEESENAFSKMKYAGAVLEICLRKVMFYPNVQTFIDDKLIEFPEVDMQYRFGAPPKLIMKDEKGNHKESIRIDNWKTDQIEQFLKEKVVSKSST